MKKNPGRKLNDFKESRRNHGTVFTFEYILETLVQQVFKYLFPSTYPRFTIFGRINSHVLVNKYIILTRNTICPVKQHQAPPLSFPPVVEKQVLLLTPAHLITILSTPSLLHTTSLVTTLLSLSPQLLAVSASDWSVPFAHFLYQ